MAELDEVREAVRRKYANVADAAAAGDAGASARCCGGPPACCTPADETGVFGAALYDATMAEHAASAAMNASLGCGVPTAVAELREGETVLDLGSGAGADVLISARRVAPGGRAIGLDMTDEMLELARVNAADAGVENAEFLRGYLEEIPLQDRSVDVVISNCAINLSADKRKVLAEAARVLRPGGRFAVSDVIADDDMDDATRADMSAWTGCVAGALTEREYRFALEEAGLEDAEVHETHRVHAHAGAAIIRARKPRRPTDLPMYGCSLEQAELEQQLARYSRLGPYALTVRHRPGELVIEFADGVPEDEVERALEVERSCCAFLEISYAAEQRRLVIAAPGGDDNVLSAIAGALAAGAR